MYVMYDKAPKTIDALEVQNFIVMGRSNRLRMKKSDPYANVKDSAAAIMRDARLIAEQYNTKSKDKGVNEAKRMEMYKEIVHIQFGYDPIPRVGDFYMDHTVTDIIRSDNKVELYGVLGKLPKRELKRIIEDAAKLDCLRDKVKRRGYRFAVMQVM